MPKGHDDNTCDVEEREKRLCDLHIRWGTQIKSWVQSWFRIFNWSATFIRAPYLDLPLPTRWQKRTHYRWDWHWRRPTSTMTPQYKRSASLDWHCLKMILEHATPTPATIDPHNWTDHWRTLVMCCLRIGAGWAHGIQTKRKKAPKWLQQILISSDRSWRGRKMLPWVLPA